MILQAAKIVNVCGCADPFDLGGIPLRQWRGLRLVPTVLTIRGPTYAVFNAILAGTLGLAPGRYGHVAVVGLHCIEPPEVETLRLRKPGKHHPLRAAPGPL